jgi:hypothetical protein
MGVSTGNEVVVRGRTRARLCLVNRLHSQSKNTGSGPNRIGSSNGGPDKSGSQLQALTEPCHFAATPIGVGVIWLWGTGPR